MNDRQNIRSVPDQPSWGGGKDNSGDQWAPDHNQPNWNNPDWKKVFICELEFVKLNFRRQYLYTILTCFYSRTR